MIAQVAIKYKDLGVVTLPRPARHHDIIGAVAERENRELQEGDIQGFITDLDEFVTRDVALQIAKGYGQIIKKHGNPNILFSEDLW